MTFAEELDALLSSTDLSALGQDPTISQFWRDEIASARQRAEQKAIGPVRVADIVRELGYGFRPLPSGSSVRKDPELTAAMKRRRFEILPGLSQLRRSNISKAQWEHLCAIGVLEDLGLLDAYLDFIGPFGIGSDMSAARHFFYSTVIQRLIGVHLVNRPINVLEIGAGAGNLAVFLLSLQRISSYVIVDLPEMLLNAAGQLRTYSRHARLMLGPGSMPLGSPRKPVVSLLKTLDIKQLPSDRFTLALNFNSFMEMDAATRDFYIKQIYRACTDGAIFYNVNRRQPQLSLKGGGTFDNNPLLYPYDTHDEILFWEDDPFQTAARGWFADRPSLAVSRAALVRKRLGLMNTLRRAFGA